MCVMSMVSDYEIDKWRQWASPVSPPNTTTPIVIQNGDPKKLEIQIENLNKNFEELRKDFLDFKKLILKAIDYDERNNEPECEVEDKVRLIKEIAGRLNIDVSDIWPENK